MSNYVNQVLTSLNQFNQTSKEASTSGESPQATSEASEAPKGLSHMEKQAWIWPLVAGLGGAFMGNKMGKSDPYNDWIPFNEPDPGEQGYDPYKAWAGNDWKKTPIAEFYSQFGPGGGGFPGGGFPGGMPYGMPGMNPKQYRKYFQQRQARGNPRNYMPGGRFIQNKDKRKAWRENLKSFNQDKPWKDKPAPAAPAAPAAPVAPAAPAAPVPTPPATAVA